MRLSHLELIVVAVATAVLIAYSVRRAVVSSVPEPQTRASRPADALGERVQGISPSRRGDDRRTASSLARVPEPTAGARRGDEREPRAARLVAERAAEAAARESIPRETVRELLQESLALIDLERTPAPHDFEVLTDAVLRIRAARRVLKELPLDRYSAEIIERHRRLMTDALAEFELVTGVSPSQLPDVLDPDSGISPAQDDDEDEIVQEPLSNYPPAGR